MIYAYFNYTVIPFMAGADLGNYGWGGGSSLCKQGRSP